MRTGLAVTLALATGCYRPASATHCAVRCDELGACPNQLQCGTDGLCFDLERGACSPDAGLRIDAPVVPGDLFDALLCSSTHFGVESCYSDAGGNLTLPSTIDTGTFVNHGDCQVEINGGAYCGFVADTIEVASVVNVSGGRPLVLVARTAITIDANATLDVASHVGGKTGPAASTTCSASMLAGSPGGSGLGGAGGGGGSFQGLGGNGGAGGGPTMYGTAGAEAMPTVLRGGCPGGLGGDNGASAGAGPVGPGGGAVYLISPGTIAIHGVINASGAGGGAGGGAIRSLSAGGGGGGSGGMIVLEALTYMIDGVVLASGGGGGGGGGGNGGNATSGANGGDPTPTNPTSAASGGAGSVTVNNGGVGSTLVVLGGGTGGPGNVAGGGASGGGAGGGGAGWIFVANPPMTDSFTPLATPL